MSVPLLLFKQRSALLLVFQLRALLIGTYTGHRSQRLCPHRSQNMSSYADESLIVSKEFVGNTALERNVEQLFLLPLFIHSFFPQIASFQFQGMCRLEIASALERIFLYNSLRHWFPSLGCLFSTFQSSISFPCSILHASEAVVTRRGIFSIRPNKVRTTPLLVYQPADIAGLDFYWLG